MKAKTRSPGPWTAPQFPNFTLTAARMADDEIRPGPAGCRGRARPERHRQAGERGRRRRRGGRGGSDDDRPAWPARRRRGGAGAGRSGAVAAVQGPDARHRRLLPQPAPATGPSPPKPPTHSPTTGDGARRVGGRRGSRAGGRREADARRQSQVAAQAKSQVAGRPQAAEPGAMGGGHGGMGGMRWRDARAAGRTRAGLGGFQWRGGGGRGRTRGHDISSASTS